MTDLNKVNHQENSSSQTEERIAGITLNFRKDVQSALTTPRLDSKELFKSGRSTMMGAADTLVMLD